MRHGNARHCYLPVWRSTGCRQTLTGLPSTFGRNPARLSGARPVAWPIAGNKYACLLPAGSVGLPPVQRTTAAPAAAQNASGGLPSAERLPACNPAPAAHCAGSDAIEPIFSIRPLGPLASKAACPLQRLSAPVAPASQRGGCPRAEHASQALHSGLPIVTSKAAAAAELRLLAVPDTAVTQPADAVPQQQHPPSGDDPSPLPEAAQPRGDSGQQTHQAADAALGGGTPSEAVAPQPQQLIPTLPRSEYSAVSRRQKPHRKGAATAGARAQKAGSAGRVQGLPATPSERTLPHRGGWDCKVDQDEMGMDSIELDRAMQRNKEQAATQPMPSDHGGAEPDAVRGAADMSAAADGRSLVDDGTEEQLTRAMSSMPISAGVPHRTEGDRMKPQAKRLRFRQVPCLCHLPPQMHNQSMLLVTCHFDLEWSRVADCQMKLQTVATTMLPERAPQAAPQDVHPSTRSQPCCAMQVTPVT